MIALRYYLTTELFIYEGNFGNVLEEFACSEVTARDDRYRRIRGVPSILLPSG